MAGTALASDETGMRVGKANWWLWVFHHRDSAVFVADKHRSKAVVEAFLGDWRASSATRFEISLISPVTPSR